MSELVIRENILGVRLTKDERALIEQHAAREDRRASDLARHLILSSLRERQNSNEHAPNGGALAASAR